MNRTSQRFSMSGDEAVGLRTVINARAKKVAYRVAREKDADRQKLLITSLLGLLKQSVRLS